MKRSFFVLVCLFLFAACAESEQTPPLSLSVQIEDWTHRYEAGSSLALPIRVSARDGNGWQGNLQLQLRSRAGLIEEWQQVVMVPPDSATLVEVAVQLPKEAGTYEWAAQVLHPDGQLIKSRRLIEVD
jgi:hypothetical protein